MDNFEKKIIGNEGQILYILPAFEDNYIYILSWDNEALVVDPGDGKKVFALLEELQLHLSSILITHFHEDHTGGIEFLKKKTNCSVIGPEDERVPLLEQSVAGGEELLFGPFRIEVFSTPGHTRAHVVYFFQDLHLLFSGDLVFGAGCGRLFEGSAEEMLNSLQSVMKLPDETEIYFGHEYTLKNLEFAHHIEPQNEEVAKRLEKVKKMREKGRFTVPTTLQIEKQTNPFLRTHENGLRMALKMEEGSDLDVFSHLRRLKDQW